jgi:hypothetical protein
MWIVPILLVAGIAGAAAVVVASSGPPRPRRRAPRRLTAAQLRAIQIHSVTPAILRDVLFTFTLDPSRIDEDEARTILAGFAVGARMLEHPETFSPEALRADPAFVEAEQVLQANYSAEELERADAAFQRMAEEEFGRRGGI